MNLDDKQKQKVRDWIEGGLKLSEIQDKIGKELGVSMTYMDVRFLIDDLGVKLKDKAPEPAPAQPNLPAPGAQPPQAGAVGKQPGGPAGAALGGPEEPGALGGGVSVTVDQITRPGALVSGKVTFSDGKSAEWYLDQMGRLGLVAKEQGYKPSQEDLVEFQSELQNELARLGL
jgi:hypothetical protein